MYLGAKKVRMILMSTIIIIFSPIVVYIYNFRNGVLSSNNQDWGDFGDYISGILSPMIALLAVLISFLVSFLSNEYNKTIILKKEMENRPLANIRYSDFEHKIEINLWNKGLGPLLITKFSVINTRNHAVKDSVYAWIKELNGELNNYSGNQDNVVLKPGAKINLLRLEQSARNSGWSFTEQRDTLRKVLCDLEIEIEYNDIYDKKMKPYKRSLRWFGRHHM